MPHSRHQRFGRRARAASPKYILSPRSWCSKSASHCKASYLGNSEQMQAANQDVIVGEKQGSRAPQIELREGLTMGRLP